MIGVHGLGLLADGRAPNDGLLGGQRRRSTLLARMAADVVAQALGERSLRDVALVLGSVGGELEQTFSNLDLLDGSPPSSSPLRFGNSVHNAALGHLSIPAGNRHFASAVAASPETIVSAALGEGLAWVADTGTPTLVVWAEEAWPGTSSHGPAAAAVLLGPEPGRFGLLGGWLASRPTQSAHPIGRALVLVEALLGTPTAGPLVLDDGGAVVWRPRALPIPHASPTLALLAGETTGPTTTARALIEPRSPLVVNGGAPALGGIEVLAQAAALHAAHVATGSAPTRGLLVSARGVEVLREHLPVGEVFEARVTAVDPWTGGPAAFDGELRHGGEVLLRGRITVVPGGVG